MRWVISHHIRHASNQAIKDRPARRATPGGRVVLDYPWPYALKLVKLPDLYHDWRFTAGLVLMILGAGNWIVGLAKTHQYSAIVAMASRTENDQSYRRFDELDQSSDRAVLAPFSAEERRVTYASTHMDFYHATFLTGQVLFALGVIITLFAFIGVVRRDARRKIREMAADASGGT